MASNQMTRPHVGFFPFLILLFNVGAAISVGWAIEALIGGMLIRGGDRYYWERFPRVFQSPLAASFVSFAFFHFVVLFSWLKATQKSFLLVASYLLCAVAFFLSSGFIHNDAPLAIFGYWEFSTIGPWLPIKSYFGWSCFVNVIIGNFIGTAMLAGLFPKYRMQANLSDKSLCNVGAVPNQFWKTVLAFVLFVVLGSYVAIVRGGVFQVFDTDLVSFFVLGIVTSVLVVLGSLAFFSVMKYTAGRLFVVLLWFGWFLLWMFLVTKSELRPYSDWLENTSYLPGILSGVFVWLLGLSAASIFRIDLLDLRNRVKGKERIPGDEVDFDPLASTDEECSKGKDGEEETIELVASSVARPRPVFGALSVGLEGVLISGLLAAGYWIPQSISPYILAVTHDWELAQVVALNKAHNEGKCFVITQDDGRSYQQELLLHPLLKVSYYEEKHPFAHSLKMTLNVQPLLSSGPEGRELFRSLKNRQKKLDFLSFVYYENGPNGKHFAEIANDLDVLPALNGKDLTKDELCQILEVSPYVMLRYRNCQIGKGYFGEHKFRRGTYEFFECQFDEGFKFDGFTGRFVGLRLINPLGFKRDHWLQLFQRQSRFHWSSCFLYEDDPSSLLLHLLAEFFPGKVTLWKIPKELRMPNLIPFDLQEKKQGYSAGWLPFLSESSFKKAHTTKFNLKGRHFEISNGNLVGLKVEPTCQVSLHSRYIDSDTDLIAGDQDKKRARWMFQKKRCRKIIWLDIDDFPNRFFEVNDFFVNKQEVDFYELRFLRMHRNVLRQHQSEELFLQGDSMGEFYPTVSILRLPSLKTVMLDFTRMAQQSLIERCEAETLVLRIVEGKSLHYKRCLQSIEKMPKVKRVVFLNTNGAKGKSINQEEADQFFERLGVKPPKVPVYLLKNTEDKFDFRFEWEDLKKRHRFLLCRPANKKQ